jgi:hypothetical protein
MVVKVQLHLFLNLERGGDERSGSLFWQENKVVLEPVCNLCGGKYYLSTCKEMKQDPSFLVVVQPLY